MRKWRQIYSSKQRRLLREEQGMTLVELLASIALLSLVILLVGTAHIFGQRQYLKQSTISGQANELSLALNQLSRELRVLPANEMTTDENRILQKEQPIFYVENGELKNADGTTLAKGLSGFQATVDEGKITVILQGQPIHGGQEQEYETIIYFRRD